MCDTSTIYKIFTNMCALLRLLVLKTKKMKEQLTEGERVWNKIMNYTNIYSMSRVKLPLVGAVMEFLLAEIWSHCSN